MIAFQIEIDSEPMLVAGVEDWSVLTCHINALKSRSATDDQDDLDFSAGGLTTKNADGISHHFRWPRIPLKIGSVIKVTLVETTSPDDPAKRYRSDREVQEDPFTEEELREMRRQDYIALKKEFENDANP